MALYNRDGSDASDWTFFPSVDEHHTILVSLTQSLLHYSSVCSKLGVNIHKRREEGSFRFVDGLSSLLSRVFRSAAGESSVPASATESDQRAMEERVQLSLTR